VLGGIHPVPAMEAHQRNMVLLRLYGHFGQHLMRMISQVPSEVRWKKPK
jgi:hypothetical protein